MMESALAAPVINLDAKTQAKQGGKAEKGDGSGKRAAFQDALSQQLATKNQSGRAKGEAADNNVDLLSADLVAADQLAEASTDGEAKLASLRQPLPAATKSRGEFASSYAGSREPVNLGVGERRTEEKPKTTQKPSNSRDTAADAVLIAVAAEDAAIDAGQKPRLKAGLAHDIASSLKQPVEKDGDGEPDTGSVRHALDMLQDMHGQVPTPLPTAEGHGHQNAPEQASDDAVSGEASGRSYKITRADGKGGTLELPASNVSDDTQLPKASTNPANVVVVDQRRYLALAPDSNAFALVNSISGEPDWSTAMQPGSTLANAASMAGTGKVVNTLKIQMHPIDLGLVTATLRLAGDELSVELKVETGAAYRQLKEDQSRIMDALKSQGFSVDQVTVTMAPERADTGQQAGGQTGGQGAGFAQQQAKDGGQGAASGRERRMAEQERAGNGGFTTDDVRTDTGAAGGSGAQRPGHVYI